MSEMIQCDKCKKLMYTDSNSDKDAYCKISNVIAWMPLPEPYGGEQE